MILRIVAGLLICLLSLSSLLACGTGLSCCSACPVAHATPDSNLKLIPDRSNSCCSHLKSSLTAAKLPTLSQSVRCHCHLTSPVPSNGREPRRSHVNPKIWSHLWNSVCLLPDSGCQWTDGQNFLQRKVFGATSSINVTFQGRAPPRA